MSKLKPYTNYQPVQYDYISQLPEDRKLLPNIAITQERIEWGFVNKEILAVAIGRGVIKQSELEKKDSSTFCTSPSNSKMPLCSTSNAKQKKFRSVLPKVYCQKRTVD